MKRLNIKKLIFSSTAAVYGNPIKLPIMENDQTTPTNPYGMTKLAVDMMIANECLAYGLAATSLRYFNVAGAYKNLGERHPNESHIIPLVFDTLSGKRDIFTLFGNDYNTKDGTCIRDYIHVADLAEAHLLALDHLKSGQHNIYNLGNGNGFSNLEVIYTTEKVTGKKISLVVRPRREGDPEVLIASSQLAKNKLGWAPKRIKLETIIEDAWNFYKK
jgi:UDP-glucose 4-epimerase